MHFLHPHPPPQGLSRDVSCFVIWRSLILVTVEVCCVYALHQISFIKNCIINVGRGGALVELKPFDRRVVDLNPSLATT